MYRELKIKIVQAFADGDTATAKALRQQLAEQIKSSVIDLNEISEAQALYMLNDSTTTKLQDGRIMYAEKVVMYSDISKISMPVLEALLRLFDNYEKATA